MSAIKSSSSLITTAEAVARITYLGDLDLGFGVKEGIGKLLTLTKGALNDFEAGNCGGHQYGIVVCRVVDRILPFERKSPTGA